jgi:lysophospholipase L1-like esterase
VIPSAGIAEGVRAIFRRLRAKTPEGRIILMAVFPRERMPGHPRREHLVEINRLLTQEGQLPVVALLDLGPKMLQPDGTIPPEIMRDFCHPTEAGYRIWGSGLAPLLAEPLSAKPNSPEKTIYSSVGSAAAIRVMSSHRNR